MKKQIISTCPVCKHDLTISAVHCNHCDITISGQFTLSKFDYLKPEQLSFVETFIKTQGNIKAIEKEMGISYPTVKRILSEVIIALGYDTVMDYDSSYAGYQAPPTSNSIVKSEILKKVAQKKMSVEEAIELLKGEGTEK